MKQQPKMTMVEDEGDCNNTLGIARHYLYDEPQVYPPLNAPTQPSDGFVPKRKRGRPRKPRSEGKSPEDGVPGVINRDYPVQEQCRTPPQSPPPHGKDNCGGGSNTGPGRDGTFSPATELHPTLNAPTQPSDGFVPKRKRGRPRKPRSEGNSGEDKKKYPSFRCFPNKLVELIGNLSDGQKKWIKEAGWGSILDLAITKIDRRLCNWLNKGYDPKTGTLVLREGSDEAEPITVVITPEMVGWVLGVPANPKDRAPPAVKSSHKDLQQMYEEYCVNKRICLLKVETAAIAEKNDRVRFLRHFLLFAIGTTLCTHTGLKISPNHMRVLHDKVVSNPEKFNWGKYILDWPVKYGRSKKSAGFAGSALLLMITYLDRINHREAAQRWHLKKARIRVWDQDSIEAAIRADQRDLEYGAAKIVEGVVYGKPYPIHIDEPVFNALDLESDSGEFHGQPVDLDDADYARDVADSGVSRKRKRSLRQEGRSFVKKGNVPKMTPKEKHPDNGDGEKELSHKKDQNHNENKGLGSGSSDSNKPSRKAVLPKKRKAVMPKKKKGKRTGGAGKARPMETRISEKDCYVEDKETETERQHNSDSTIITEGKQQENASICKEMVAASSGTGYHSNLFLSNRIAYILLGISRSQTVAEEVVCKIGDLEVSRLAMHRSFVQKGIILPEVMELLSRYLNKDSAVWIRGSAFSYIVSPLAMGKYLAKLKPNFAVDPMEEPFKEIVGSLSKDTKRLGDCEKLIVPIFHQKCWGVLKLVLPKSRAYFYDFRGMGVDSEWWRVAIKGVGPALDKAISIAIPDLEFNSHEWRLIPASRTGIQINKEDAGVFAMQALLEEFGEDSCGYYWDLNLKLKESREKLLDFLLDSPNNEIRDDFLRRGLKASYLPRREAIFVCKKGVN